MEIRMFLLTTARGEKSRVGRKALKHQLKALKHLPKALKHQLTALKQQPKALKHQLNRQPKALKRLLGRLTSAFPTR